jgi:hypothetical protein
MSTEDLAFAMLGQIGATDQLVERLRQQRELREAMRGVVADARRSAPLSYPGGGRPPKRDEVAAPQPPQPAGTGWREARPLEPPGGATTQRYIEPMTHAMQPHQPGNPEYRGPRAETALAKAVATARATPKASEAAPTEVAPPAQSAPQSAPPAAPAIATPAAPTAEAPTAVAEPKAVAQPAGVTRRRLA